MPRDVIDNRDVKRVLKEILAEAPRIAVGQGGDSLQQYRIEHFARLLEWLDMRFPVQHRYHATAGQVIKQARKFTKASGNMVDLTQAVGRFDWALDNDPSATNIVHVTTVEKFQELAAKYGPWHEPDEQGVSGRVSSGGLGTAGNSTIEATLVVYLIGLPLFEVNVSLLIEWAAWPPKAAHSTAGEGK